MDTEIHSSDRGLKKIIVIIGSISSGKSTAAKAISEQFKIPIASFGGFLAHHCLSHGLSTDRTNLQDVGEQFIRQRPNEFLLDVIDFSDKGVNKMLIEGVRHKVIFELIQEIFPKAFSVFLDVPYQIRLERFLIRDKESDAVKSNTEFQKMNKHPVELEVQGLKDKCSLVIESFPNEEFINQVNLFLKD